MLTSTQRVAASILIARVWETQRVDNLLLHFRVKLNLFEKGIAEWKLAAETKPNERASQAGLQYQWESLVRVTGSQLAEWVLETREIPPGKAKAVELSTRVFISATRKPSDVISWWEKNEKYVRLLNEALTWPEKRENGDTETPQILNVGSFVVHNTILASGTTLESVKGVIKEAESVVSGSPFSKVLYGPVYVVGKIEQAKTLAWYKQSTDDIYVRAFPNVNHNEIRSLVHELGHRWWFKFMSTAAKRAITRWYQDLDSSTEIPLSQVGDKLPVPLKGYKDPPTITKINWDRYEIDVGGSVKIDVVNKILKGIRGYPTPYSATNNEEFFAELFCMYLLGTLQPKFLEVFQKIMIDGNLEYRIVNL